MYIVSTSNRLTERGCQSTSIRRLDILSRDIIITNCCIILSYVSLFIRIMPHPSLLNLVCRMIIKMENINIAISLHSLLIAHSSYSRSSYIYTFFAENAACFKLF